MPKLVNACRFPFLRIKKPQPLQLSRIISDSIKIREKRLTRSQRLRKEISLAEGEDLWDKLLCQKLGLSIENKEPSWVEAPRNAMTEVNKAQNRAAEKRMEMANRMTDIVEKETTLAEEERWQRKDVKHKERKARRLARQGKDPTLAWKAPNGSGLVTDTSYMNDSVPVEDGAEMILDHRSNKRKSITRGRRDSRMHSVSFISLIGALPPRLRNSTPVT